MTIDTSDGSPPSSASRSEWDDYVRQKARFEAARNAVGSSPRSNPSLPSANLPGQAHSTPQLGIQVTEVRVGNEIGADNLVTAPLAYLDVMDTIYTSVATSGSGLPATLTARLIWNGPVAAPLPVGNVIDESSQNVAGAGMTEFHMSKRLGYGWFMGRYQLEVLLNGELVATRAFQVF